MGQSSDTRDSAPFSPRQSRATAEPVSVQALEQLRERVHRRLDEIQELLRDRVATVATDNRESEWSRRIEELETALEASKREVERAERERVAELESLDQDRALLAEAWERLERDRVACETGRTQAAPIADSTSRASAPGLISTRVSPIRSSSANPADDSVERAVFQQFQALRRDVRRKADSRIVD